MKWVKPGIRHISTTTHFRVLCLYIKKVTHEVMWNLHNRNHDNQKIYIFWIGVILWESHEKEKNMSHFIIYSSKIYAELCNEVV